jgi:hypothetical protein
VEAIKAAPVLVGHRLVAYASEAAEAHAQPGVGFIKAIAEPKAVVVQFSAVESERLLFSVVLLLVPVAAG